MAAVEPAIHVARARLEEVQPLARRYSTDPTVAGPPETPLPAQAVYWVARDAAGEAVGYAAGTLRPDGVLLGPVYVLPEHRRSGVAMALLHDAQRWADGARIPVVEVSVAVDNPAGVRFLEAAGYRTRRLLMAREPGQ